MSKHLFDGAAVLMPQGTYTTTQSFPPLQISPRHLPTSVVAISLGSPPSATATFVVEVATTQNGVYTPVGVLPWPAGVVGARQTPLAVGSSPAETRNNQSAWIRLSLTTSGPLTGMAWLTKPTDGGVGLASRSYSLDNINVI